MANMQVCPTSMSYICVCIEHLVCIPFISYMRTEVLTLVAPYQSYVSYQRPDPIKYKYEYDIQVLEYKE